MVSIALVIATVLVFAALAFHPRFRTNETWHAMVVPLASIMGSGFLVSAPMLGEAVGPWAMPAMAGLLVVAYAFGHVMRFNIQYAEQRLLHGDGSNDDAAQSSNHRLQNAHRKACEAAQSDGQASRIVERVSHVGLALAYAVTIAYYLQLLAAFALSRFGVEASWAAPVIATSIIVALTLIGLSAGLRLLEKVDRFAIALNFGVIAAILLGLAIYNVQAFSDGTWTIPAPPTVTDPLHTTRVLMGLLIVVQGFETSRFLGSEHSAELRVRTMRFAQLLSSGIYVVFLSLITVLNGGAKGGDADVTAVIDLLTPVAPILPILVLGAAIMSQFSAAVADDSGNVGLVQALLGKRTPKWLPFILIGAVAIGVIWLTDPVEVIAWASRAFAVFYGLQCIVAALTAKTADVSMRGVRIVAYSALGLVAFAVAAFGIPAG